MRKIAAVLALSLVLGGVAYASIPDSGGVIHGCYKNTGTKELIVIDSASQSCPSNYTALNWSQTGPQGAAGPAGATGATGAEGPAGGATYEMVEGSTNNNGAGFSTQVEVFCDEGMTALGGGFEINPQNASDFPLIHYATADFIGNPPNPTGYKVQTWAESGLSGTYRVFAQVVCGT